LQARQDAVMHTGDFFTKIDPFMARYTLYNIM